VRGLQLLREQIELQDTHIVGLHTRDAARALPGHLQLGRTALAVFRVLCAAKDETSVDIMGRMFCCKFVIDILCRDNKAEGL
jgi:hypothetical protein